MIVGPIIAAVLTLLVLSYLIADNPFYRLSLHIFVGVVIGYAVGLTVREVLLQVALPKLLDNPATVVAPLVLGILLLFKGFPQQAFVGNVSVAFLIGVGAAVAVAGALLGTLGPQIEATGRALSPTSLASFRFGLLDGLMMVVGTICTLLMFTFTRLGRDASAPGWRRLIDGASWVGRIFLVVAFGVVFAGAVTASLTVFAGRVQFLIDLAQRALGL